MPILTITAAEGTHNGQHQITKIESSGFLESEPDEKMKPGIFITARVHPGETNSSWMMKGVLDFLTSESDYAKVLINIVVERC